MNRRIPNGTYGGVGGRRLDASSYPMCSEPNFDIAQICAYTKVNQK